MFRDLILLAVRSLYSRKLRTSLTVLGVVIGVAAIVGLIGATEGISSMILGEVEKFQSDMISIIPGSFNIGFDPSMGYGPQEAVTLTDKDVDELGKIAGVDIVSGMIDEQLEIDYNDEVKTLTIAGVVPEHMKEIYNYDIIEGRLLSSSDQKSAVLGYSVARTVFEEEIGIKKKILIDGEEFRVVGVFEEVGGMFRVMDTMVYIPQETIKDVFDKEDEFSEIIVKVEEGVDTSLIGDEIEYRLQKRHKVTSEDKAFTVITPEFSREITEQITSLISVLIGGIAGISLVVGAIGISNMMFTAVMERTREIGMMKAIGATNNNVLMIFLIESGIVGLVGGILGIFLGYLLGEGFLVARQFMVSGAGFVPGTEMPHILVTPELISFALTFSFVVGILAGYLPARRASKLQPVEALRYE